MNREAWFGLGVLVMLLVAYSYALGQELTSCPSSDLKQCFSCTGSEVTYYCCFDPNSPTAQQCVVFDCENPTELNCNVPPTCAEQDQRILELEQQVLSQQQEINYWAQKAHADNGQLWSDHWYACALNNFQLWHALHGGVPQ